MTNDSGSERFSLRNKTILVTGGTRGIGLAISLRFARSGAKVIANYLRDERSAEHLKATAAKECLEISLCRADLTSEQGIKRLGSLLEEKVRIFLVWFIVQPPGSTAQLRSSLSVTLTGRLA